MGIKTNELGPAYTASMAAPGHEVAVTPLIGKLRLHIQGYVGHEEFYIMPLEGCDVLLGMPWFYNHKAVLDSFNKTVTLEIRGRKIVLDVKLKGKTVPLGSASAVPRLMKQHIFAYLIYVKERDETESSNLSSLDVSRCAFLDEYADCFSEALPGQLPPERPEDHNIDLIPGSAAPNKPPYRVSAAQQEEIMTQHSSPKRRFEASETERPFRFKTARPKRRFGHAFFFSPDLLANRVDEIRAVWNTRWDWFHKPIHAVAHILHPLWGNDEQYSNDELEEGFMEYMRRVSGDNVDTMRRIEDDLLAFRNHSLHFGRATARLRETQLQPVSWWEKYGNCAPTLKRFAIRVLSQDYKPSQVNVDKIDIEKVRDIPEISSEERDIYSMLYEVLTAPVHETRAQRSRARGTRAAQVEAEPEASSSSSQSEEQPSDDEMEHASSDDA
ncbi:hypothetical protein L7F22_014265 [Adiantum nelumboides]|nr:hypothetical protein [Adiantum nelumboides]